LTPELRDGYLCVGGNVSAVGARRGSRARATDAPDGLSTRAVAGRARFGQAGRREHGLYLRYEALHRNAVWQADHKQLPVLVVPPGRRRARRPWVTLFLDDLSRAIMGWAISLQPSSAEALAALRAAILLDSDRDPSGGLPSRLRWDHETPKVRVLLPPRTDGVCRRVLRRDPEDRSANPEPSSAGRK
jgi:putative transposase